MVTQEFSVNILRFFAYSLTFVYKKHSQDVTLIANFHVNIIVLSQQMYNFKDGYWVFLLNGVKSDFSLDVV